MKKFIYGLALAAAIFAHATAQSSHDDSLENLQKYVPLLPSVKTQNG
jgi:hypothetical protein